MHSAQLEPNRKPWMTAGMLLWGLVLALWLARVYFLHGPQQSHANHEHDHYALRLIEFRNLLGSGFLSPQWASHFRGGLGSPYFSYYQSGFFYTASTVPWSVAPSRAIGISVGLYAFLGYASTFSLVRRFFGNLSGWLAGSLLLLSVYAATEIYLRGDLSEFAAMMLVPANLACLAAWHHTGRRLHLALLALAGAALICTHPAIALVGYPLLGLICASLLCSPTTRPRALGALLALGCGVGLAAWYWLPVFREWKHVSPEKAFTYFYHYTEHFIDATALVGRYQRDSVIPFTLGPVLPAAVAVSLLTWILRRGRATGPQRWVLALSLAALAGVVLLMTPAGEFVWAQVSLLERLQFPWRLLTLATTLAAIAAGACLPWPWERARTVFAIAAVGASLALSPTYTDYELDPDGIRVQSAARLSQMYFAPDIADEWMPVGATTETITARLSATGKAHTKCLATPEPEGYHASVEQLVLAQGRITAEVRASHPTHVLLPHYAFPVGWKATLAGEPLDITAGRGGLMRVTLPAESQGTLDVHFTGTPMRALGLWISGCALVVGMFLLRFVR